MNTDALLTGGGFTGLVIAVGYVGKLAIDFLRDRQAGEVNETSAAVSDASTANAIILKGMKAVSEENAGLRAENKDLKEEIRDRDAKILELQKALGEAQARIQYIADELQKLKSHP